jgi:ABC-type multidrug transport system fused ATPase/permease subunit
VTDTNASTDDSTDTTTASGVKDVPAEKMGDVNDQPEDDDGVFGDRFRRWVNYLVLLALALLALVAGIRFYAAVGTMIDRFIVQEFQPVFHAAFNLALLFVAGAGVTLQLRRMQ